MEILLKYLAVTVLKIILDVVNESPVLLHFTVVAGPHAIFSLPDRGLGNVSVVGPFPRALSLLLETNSQNSKRLSGVDYHYQYVNTPAVIANTSSVSALQIVVSFTFLLFLLQFYH